MLQNEHILVTGCTGRVARSLVRALLNETEAQIFMTSRNEVTLQTDIDDRITFIKLDPLDKAAVKKIVTEHSITTIVNAAALTNVDLCEEKRDVAWQVNVHMVEQLVQICRIHGIKFVQYSTDYVFDGSAGPYAEIDLPKPINYYGKTKLAAENIIKSSGIDYLILRTNVVFSPEYTNTPDFVQWVLRNLSEKNSIRITTGQWCTPTLASSLANTTVRALTLKKTGLYHISGFDYMNRYDLAVSVATSFKYPSDLIIPIDPGELQQKAQRPERAGLINYKVEAELGVKMLPLEKALKKLQHRWQNLVSYNN